MDAGWPRATGWNIDCLLAAPACPPSPSPALKGKGSSQLPSAAHGFRDAGEALTQ